MSIFKKIEKAHEILTKRASILAAGRMAMGFAKKNPMKLIGGSLSAGEVAGASSQANQAARMAKNQIIKNFQNVTQSV
jgi:hypothetical protein